ncbi:MAG: hypothetical protein IKQ09_04435 [Bacteroidales bacterium]|nr:hypothetical protein [Bacteroidales bacterium]
MVKKRLVLLLVCLFSAACLNAQEARKHAISADLAAQGLVGFNNTYRWYEGADLKGVMHVDNNDFYLNLEALTANVYSAGLSVRPNIELCRNGFGYIDVSLHSRFFVSYKVYEFVYSASLGFKMRHFDVQLGLFTKIIDGFSRDWDAVECTLTEPFKFLYKLRISIMGFDNPWDIYLTGANFNEFEYERMWSPLFNLGGRWDFKERWSALAEGTLKPAGMFHGAVRFYETIFRIGVSFKLKK